MNFRIHIYTTVGVILTLTGLFLLPSEWILGAFIYCFLSYFISVKEVSKYTSWFQFVAVFAATLGLGVSLDYPFQQFPWFTIGMFFVAWGTIGRVIFLPVFTLTGYKWFEPLMMILSVGVLLTANLMTDVGWKGWLFTMPLLLFQALLLWGVYKDMKQLGSHALKGYKVQTGTEAPDFTLPDQNGSMVKLSSYRGKRHLLLIFVRGDWCPACHMMLRTYMKNTEKFREKEVFCMAIGPDEIGVNREMVIKLGLDFKVLADDHQRTAMNYGVQLDKYDNDFADKYDEGIPLPASFLVDKNGMVRYVSRPDRVGEFLDPARIFPILEGLEV